MAPTRSAAPSAAPSVLPAPSSASVAVIQNHGAASAVASLALAHRLRQDHDRVFILDGEAQIRQVRAVHVPADGILPVAGDAPELIAALAAAGQVEYAAWHHPRGTDRAAAFARLLAARSPAGTPLTLSLVPDGFANIYRSRSLRQTIAEAVSGVLAEAASGAASGAAPDRPVELGPIYQFLGADSFSRAALAPVAATVVGRADYLQALDGYRSAEVLRSAVARLRAQVAAGRFERVVIVAMRPWSTGFHGGSYAFGTGTDTLFAVYDDILARLLRGDGGRTLCVFRGDDRHADIQRAVVARFADRLGAGFHDLSDALPPAVTLEVFLAAAFAKFGADCDKALVALDSSTPFPIAALGWPMEVWLGAPTALLAAEGATAAQIRYIGTLTDRTRMLVREFLAGSGLAGLDEVEAAPGLHRMRITVPRPDAVQRAAGVAVEADEGPDKGLGGN